MKRKNRAKGNRKKSERSGRRRFAGSKLAHPDAVSRPLGEAPVGFFIPESREALIEFLPQGVSFPPPTFAQLAEQYLHMLRSPLSHHNIGLWKKWKHGDERNLDYYEMLNANNYPNDFNTVELPPDLLHKVMSRSPLHALEQYDVVRRALARLYSVAWFGKGTDAVEARKQLEQLIPRGNKHAVTEHLPALAKGFLRLKCCIVESNKLILQKHSNYTKSQCNEILAKLYGENGEVIADAVGLSEQNFLRRLMPKLLRVSETAVRLALRN